MWCVFVCVVCVCECGGVFCVRRVVGVVGALVRVRSGYGLNLEAASGKHNAVR